MASDHRRTPAAPAEPGGGPGGGRAGRGLLGRHRSEHHVGAVLRAERAAVPDLRGVRLDRGRPGAAVGVQGAGLSSRSSSFRGGPDLPEHVRRERRQVSRSPMPAACR